MTNPLNPTLIALRARLDALNEAIESLHLIGNLGGQERALVLLQNMARKTAQELEVEERREK